MKRIYGICILALSLLLITGQIAQGQAIKIMPLGDSITRGIDGSNPVGGYRYDLDSLLTNAGITFDFVGSLQDGSGFDADHEGHGGWRADDIDANIDAFLNNSDPDIVLLHIGTNDVSNGDDNAQTIVEIESIIEKIKDYDAGIPVLLCSLIPRNDIRNTKNDNMNAYIEDLFYTKKQNNYNIYYVGQNEVFETNPNWATDYLNDDVHPNNTGYLVMAKVYYNAILNVINDTLPYVTDNFNQRTQLGETWSAESTITVVNNMLTNTNPNDDQLSDWDLAIYTAQKNPSTVSYLWGPDANTEGIQRGGFALKLNKVEPLNEVEGYLLWIGSNNNINLWTIENGLPNDGVTGGSVPSLLPAPQAGDTIQVKMQTNSQGHHFSVFINSDSAGIVTDTNKIKGNDLTRYAGVMLRGGTSLNNDIDDFELYKEGDTTPPATIVDLQTSNISASSFGLNWTAPGDDDNTGLASSYDIRYSTTQIYDNTDFNNATPVSNPPDPQEAGTQESLTISGLEQNTSYYVAIKTADEVPNWSQMSNVVVATTTEGLEFVDTFNRTDLGNDWTADPEFEIVNGELSNSASTGGWDYVACYNARKNPIELAFNYGSLASTDDDFEFVSLLFLDAAAVNGNGYMAQYRPSKDGIYLWKVENGGTNFVRLGYQDNVGAPALQAGDQLKVGFSQDGGGNNFTYYINDVEYGTLTDPDTLYGNNADLYPGVMMHAGYNNSIDNFTILNAPGSASDLVKVDGDMQSGTVNTDLPLPLVVRVTDENGNPIENVSINFTVTEGNGHVDKDAGDGNIRIEAESGTITAPMTSVEDGTVSGGYYVMSSQTKQGLDEINFYIVESGTYTIWGRVNAANGNENSFRVLVDDQVDTTFWHIGSPSDGTNGQWEWQKITSGSSQDEVTYNFSEGSHLLKVCARESYTKLDKILITKDPNYVPSGLEGAQGYVTNSSGEAEAVFTLGTVAGQNQVKATAPILPGQEVLFTETGNPDVPDTLIKVSGDSASGSAGEPLTEPFVVKITDQYGNPISNESVTFEVIEGGGSLSNEQPVMTDVNGQASTTLTLSNTQAYNEVEARVEGLGGSPIVFTAKATSGVPSDIIYVSGDSLTGAAGEILSEPFVIKVVDGQGDGIGDQTVNWSVTQSNGVIQGSQPTVTDTNGLAQVYYQLGDSKPDTNQVTATWNDSSIVFTAIATSGIPKELVAVSNLTQSGTVGKQLLIQVKVEDAQNNGMSNYDVTFEITEGGGSIVESQPVQTDENGIAQVNWVLSNQVGMNKLQAQAPNLNGSPILFTATGTADVANELIEISGDSLTGVVDQQLTNPFVVKVTDQYGNAVQGEGVTFSVIEGGGQFLNEQVTRTVNTDSSGLAKAFLVLGPVAGQYNNKVTAEKSGLTGSPIEFVASATASNAAKIVKVSGDSQLGYVRQPLSDSLVVKVMDANDNAVSGHSVSFKVISGDGTINGETDTLVTVQTDENGLAYVHFWPGPVAGELNHVVHAMSDNGENPLTNSPIEFKASAKYIGTKLQMVSGDSQSAVVTSVLSQPLTVKILDASDQPVENQPVTFEVKAGGGKFGNSDSVSVKYTNSEGIASVTYQLGPSVGEYNNIIHAIADDGFDPLTGSPVEFVASATSSNAVKVQIAGGNGQTGFAGQALPENVQLSVLDSLDNPVSNHPVTFTITQGNGHFEGGDTIKTVNSNTSGIAEVKWYLGTVAGTDNNQLKAESTDGINPLNGSPITFTASAEAGMTDPDVSTVEATSPVIADGSSVSNVTVALFDQYENPIANKAVSISVSGSHNFVDPSSVNTNVNGVAVFSLTSITAEMKSVTATNTTDNVELNSTAQVAFQPGPATKIVRESGNDQTRNVGTILKAPLVVKIEDAYGNPVSGVSVYFEVKDGSTGGYLIEDQPVVSDTNGTAKANYILGSDVGTNLIEAKSGSLTGSPVLFSENGVENTASQLVYISGDEQDGVAGQALSQPLVVQTLDQNGDPVKEVPVTYSVTLGGGEISQSQPVLTDASGKTSVQFILGPSVGVHIAKAESQGLDNSPISFVANASSGEATKLRMVSGDGQSGTVMSTGTPLKVQVLDNNDNPVENYPVLFEVVSGGVSITNTQPDTSDAGGYAEANFQYGSSAGDCSIQAEAEGLQNSPIQFHTTALPDIATTIEKVSGDNQIGTVDHELVYPLKVKIRDQWGNGVPDYSITFVITQGDALIQGNSTIETDNHGNANCRILAGSSPSNLQILAVPSTTLDKPHVTFNATTVHNELPTISTQLDSGTIEETQSISVQVTGDDGDGDILQFNVQNKPEGASLDSVDVNRYQFDWTPDYMQAGDYNIRFEVLDGKGGVDRDTVFLKVLNKNREPVITNFEPQRDSTLTQGQGIVFSIQADDADQETLHYFWTKNGETVASTESYHYSSSPDFEGEDIIIGHVTDQIDTVFHRWVITVESHVELESFTATPYAEKLAIRISWSTRSERDNLGFNIYRSKHKDGEFRKINNDLIPPEDSGLYSYRDQTVEAGIQYYYKLEDVSIYGIRTMHGPVLSEVSLPNTFSLEQNYPNPFNPETTIKFQLPKRVHVSISIFNILGQEVKKLVDTEMEAGFHTKKWDGRNKNGNHVPSGIYYYRIKAEEFMALKKMILMK